MSTVRIQPHITLLTILPGFFFLCALLPLLLPMEAEAATIGRSQNNLGLIGYWDFEVIANGNVYDRSGNGNTGVLNNMDNSDIVDGIIGQSVTFDRDNSECVDVGDVLDMGTSDQTVSLWHKTTFDLNSTQHNLVTKRRSTTADDGFEIRLQIVGGIARAQASLGGASSNNYTTPFVGPDINDGEWHHIVAVYDRDGDLTVYVDSASSTSIDISADDGYDAQTNRELTFAAQGIDCFENFSTGEIDEVRIYNRTLSQGEIDRLYRLGITGGQKIGTSPTIVSDGLVGHWTFDESDIDVSGATTTIINRGGAGGVATTTTAGFAQTSNPATTIVEPSNTINNINMPTTVDSGDLLLGVVTTEIGGASESISTPTGWTELDQGSRNTAGVDYIYTGFFAKVADGTEGGGTVNFSTSANTSAATLAQVYRVTDWHGAIGDVEAGASVTSGNTTPAVPSLTASWGAEKNLWFVMAGCADDDESFTGFPSGYSNSNSFISGYGANDGASVGSARRENEVASETPGSFTITGTEGCVGNTIVVRGTTTPSAGAVDADGILNGAKKAVVGQVGQALSMDGSDTYINVGNMGTVHAVSFWMKTDDVTSQKLINIDGTDQIEINGSSQVAATSFPAPTIYINGTPGSAITAGEWQHVTVVDSTGVDATTFEIGRVSSSYFDGIIDDVRAYNQVLSAREIERLYNGTAPKAINSSFGSQLTDGLLSHWTFDGNALTNATATDVIGDNDGTLYGGLSGSDAVIGKLNQAIESDGIDDGIRIADTASLQNLEPFSISVWIKPNSAGPTGYGRIVAKDNGLNIGLWQFTMQDDDPYFDNFLFQKDYTGTSLTIRTADNTASYGEWQHLVLTWDGSDSAFGVHMYKDGAEMAYQSQIDPTGSKASDVGLNLRIGNRSDAGERSFDGSIDDVRLYDRVLSADEVKRLYNMGK